MTTENPLRASLLLKAEFSSRAGAPLLTIYTSQGRGWVLLRWEAVRRMHSARHVPHLIRMAELESSKKMRRNVRQKAERVGQLDFSIRESLEKKRIGAHRGLRPE